MRVYLVPKYAGAVLKGSTAVLIYMYSSCVQIFHGVVMLYHMRILQCRIL